MSDELLSDIVAAEREIRRRNATLERELAERRAVLAAELAAALQQETNDLERELTQNLDQAASLAKREAAALLVEARADADRISTLDPAELDQVIARSLTHLHPEGTHDRPDEQT